MYILGLILFAAPLLFGSVYPWAYGLLEVGILVSFLFSMWGAAGRQAEESQPPAWGLWCLLGLIAWAGVQLIPMPSDMVKLVAEPIYQLWQLDFLPADIARPRALLPLTVYPFATASTGLLWLCYALAFILAWRLGRSPRPASLPWLVMLAGLAVATVAIVQKGLDAKAIYGFFTPLHSRSFTGPYVNYNHFAGYLELALPLGICLLALGLQARRGRSANSGQAWVCGGAVAIMAAALFMSRSRGGIFAFALVTLGQILVVTALLSRTRAKSKIVTFGLVFLLLIGVGAHMTDWSRILPRFHRLFQEDPVTNIRWKLFKDVWGMSKQLPLTGSGLGTFRVGYPPFKTIPRQGVFIHAHNDYLEILAEAGWPGLLLFLGFVTWVLVRGGRALLRAMSRRTRGDPEAVSRALLITGCLGGVVSLLIHGLVDFNLRIPANALTWFVLCGLTVGLSGQGEPRPEQAAAGPAPPVVG
ncbi:MAG: O-antigen ligase family protein [Desulfarculaceae bacterium]|nr:O-antigen ligase family protein [Desulfarculaceae bacterium]MCF8118312.1 O-antigen ligase family protein [Desulfarculaceae bacterium]